MAIARGTPAAVRAVGDCRSLVMHHRLGGRDLRNVDAAVGHRKLGKRCGCGGTVVARSALLTVATTSAATATSAPASAARLAPPLSAGRLSPARLLPRPRARARAGPPLAAGADALALPTF